MNTSYTLRPATESDLVAINDIYNHYVLHSTCTYQEEPEPLAGRRKWFNHHGHKHPVIVAVAADGQVVGWGSLSVYHERSAFLGEQLQLVLVSARNHFYPWKVHMPRQFMRSIMFISKV